MSRKRILMIPTWYPTEKNPYSGTFFREQAIALKDKFEFIVLLNNSISVHISKYILMKLFGKTNPKVSYLYDDNGLEIYEYRFVNPKFLILKEFVSKLKKHKSQNRVGIGIYELNFVKKSRRKNVHYLYDKNLLPSFDLVYGLTAQDIAPLISDFSKEYKVPYVLAEHGPFPWPGSLLSDETIEAMENANLFFTISNDKIRQIMMQNICVRDYYIANMVDEERFSLKENHDIKTFLIVAANSFYKNYPLFIRAMEYLKSIATKEFKIIICGYKSNKGYSKESEKLESQIRNSSISNNVQLIGAVQRDEMPEIYRKSDVFVMTSIQEGLPVSAIEASICGLPVISTCCGGVEDYIDEKMGKIFSILDYKSIAEACNDYLNGVLEYDSNEIRQRAIGLFGKKSFVNRFADGINVMLKQNMD